MKWLDPLYWMSQEQYDSLLNTLVTHILGGLGARIISALLLTLSVWFVLRRKNLPIGLIFMAGCIFILFGTWFRWTIIYLVS